MAKTKSNMAKAKTVYSRMFRDGGNVRPERQKVMKRLMGKAFGMTQKGASSYYGTLKDIPTSELS